jgi:hypothetical protein
MFTFRYLHPSRHNYVNSRTSCVHSDKSHRKQIVSYESGTKEEHTP